MTMMSLVFQFNTTIYRMFGMFTKARSDVEYFARIDRVESVECICQRVNPTPVGTGRGLGC